MSLKDQMDRDLDMFLNLTEFGEERNVDGRLVACVLDESTEGEFTGGLDGGVYMATKKLFMREADLVRRPVQGKIIRIDGEPYTVLAISREIGMITITLFEESPT